jgi:hypothetical protein
VRVVEGGNRLAKTRHHLDTAGLTPAQWHDRWHAARYRIQANGSADEPFGNLTITVTPDGEASVRLPKPLEHLANAKHGRRRVAGAGHRRKVGVLHHHSQTRPCRSVPYRRLGVAPDTFDHPETPGAEGPVVGVDLNDGHLAVRRLDAHGNPVGVSARIDVDLSARSTRRDAQVRHAITRLIHYTQRHGIDTIAVEDLDFADTRSTGRETLGRGRRGKRFRRTVAGIPTAVFRHRLAAQTSRHGLGLYAVNPAYTSAWGEQHWRKPYQNVTRHQAAATVIGRRAQGFTARRRKGVTRTRPEDRAVRATNQAVPDSRQATTGSRHRPGTRGTESRQPNRARTRLPGRATVTPAMANNGQIDQ